MSCTQTSTGVPLLGCCAQIVNCTMQAGAASDEITSWGGPTGLAELEALVDARLAICSAFANPRCVPGLDCPGGQTVCYGFSFIGGLRKWDWLKWDPNRFGSETLVPQLTCVDSPFLGYNIPYPGSQYPGSPGLGWAIYAMSYYAIRSDGYAFLIKQHYRICPNPANCFPPFYPGPFPFCLQTQHFACPPPGLGASVIAETARVPIVCPLQCTVPAPAASFGPSYGPFQPNGELAFAIYGTLINVLQPPC